MTCVHVKIIAMFYTFAYVCDLQKAQHHSALQTSLPSFSTRSRLQSNHITSKKSMAKTTCDFAACCPVLPLTSLLIVMEVKSSQTWQSGSSGNFTIKRRLNSCHFPAKDCPSNRLKAATPTLSGGNLATCLGREAVWHHTGSYHGTWCPRLHPGMVQHISGFSMIQISCL